MISVGGPTLAPSPLAPAPEFPAAGAGVPLAGFDVPPPGSRLPHAEVRQAKISAAAAAWTKLSVSFLKCCALGREWKACPIILMRGTAALAQTSGGAEYLGDFLRVNERECHAVDVDHIGVPVRPGARRRFR